MQESSLHSLLQEDQKLWYHINVLWQNEVLNTLTPILRNPLTWLPLYVFLAIFIPYKFGKKGIYWCLSFIITFALSDYTSASIIKPLVHRIRPCNDAVLQKTVHLLIDCGGGYSFPSAHATNHFALAFFMIFSLGHLYRWMWLPAFIWAFSVAYAQVYVGVHYPLDVICGGLLGIFIGVSTGVFFKNKIGLGKK
ncbi:MAG: phosphatase PAP2 family protein [Phycisphaerales bacterium]|nr:phosphatase PAP2 family protein [Phycisphaerales bacterium]